MISRVLISALISLLNTDGLETNSSLLTAVWLESLWALPVFWDWSMTGWRDAYEVRFQIPSEPVNFAKKNSPHVVCTWNSIWQTWGCQGHSRFRTNPPNHHHRTRKGLLKVTGAETREDDEEGSAILYPLSLCPVSFRSITRTAQKRRGNKKEVRGCPGNL